MTTAQVIVLADGDRFALFSVLDGQRWGFGITFADKRIADAAARGLESHITLDRLLANEFKRMEAHCQQVEAERDRWRNERNEWWARAQVADPRPDSRALLTLGDACDRLRAERDAARGAA